MGKTTGATVYGCDACGTTVVPPMVKGRQTGELPRGFHGGAIEAVYDGAGRTIAPWWACSDACLKKLATQWIRDKEPSAGLISTMTEHGWICSSCTHRVGTDD